MFQQIHYSKAPKDSKYLGKSIMVKHEPNGQLTVACIIKTISGKPVYQGISLTLQEAKKVADWLNSQQL